MSSNLVLPVTHAVDSNVRERADRVMSRNPGVNTYDTAMPQGTVDKLINAGFDPRGKCVMWYGADCTYGMLGGLTQQWDADLYQTLASLNG